MDSGGCAAPKVAPTHIRDLSVSMQIPATKCVRSHQPCARMCLIKQAHQCRIILWSADLADAEGFGQLLFDLSRAYRGLPISPKAPKRIAMQQLALRAAGSVSRQLSGRLGWMDHALQDMQMSQHACTSSCWHSPCRRGQLIGCARFPPGPLFSVSSALLPLMPLSECNQSNCCAESPECSEPS